MTADSASPLAAFVSRLVSLGLAGQPLADMVALAELAFGTARGSGSKDAERERWRLKKASQRARQRGLSKGQGHDPIISKTPKDINKQVKEEHPRPHVPGDNPKPDDGWPEDHVEQFWRNFPPYRRQAKAKVGEKLARIRATGKVSWETLFGGVLKFAATNPGEYAPAPMVWLNDGRWDREYGPPKQGGSNGTTQGTDDIRRAGFSGLAARARRAGQEPERPAPEYLEPVNGRRHS